MKRFGHAILAVVFTGIALLLSGCGGPDDVFIDTIEQARLECENSGGRFSWRGGDIYDLEMVCSESTTNVEF